MRLLLLTPEFDGNGGGISTFYRELATTLHAEGLELHEQAPARRLTVGAALDDVHRSLIGRHVVGGYFVGLAARRGAHRRRLASARMHLEMGLGLELADLDQRPPVLDRQALLGTTVSPHYPG